MLLEEKSLGLHVNTGYALVVTKRDGFVTNLPRPMVSFVIIQQKQEENNRHPVIRTFVSSCRPLAASVHRVPCRLSFLSALGFAHRPQCGDIIASYFLCVHIPPPPLF